MENEFLESHEMKDKNVEPDPNPEDEEETSFIENDSDDDYEISFIRNNPEDDVIISEERNRKIKRSFDYKNSEDFFTNILDLGPKCSDPEFVDYLTDSGILSIKREFSESGLVIDYSVKHLGEDFKSIGRVLTEDDKDLLRDGIRLHYDKWNERKMNKALKKAGIATAIGLSVIALISGLSIGLTRKGADMVHQAKKWEKLTPAIRKKSVSWTELEKATGRVVIFTGEHILIVIIGISIIVYSK